MTEPAPAAPRRGMAFADAVFDGAAVLDGLTALRVDTSAELRDALAARKVVPVYGRAVFPNARSGGLVGCDRCAHAQARCARVTTRDGSAHNRPRPKFRRRPDGLISHVETMWGERLGAIIEAGSTMPLAGEPRPIGGVGRARFVYAPAGGRFETSARIGDRVEESAVIATIGEIGLRAPISGCDPGPDAQRRRGRHSHEGYRGRSARQSSGGVRFGRTATAHRRGRA